MDEKVKDYQTIEDIKEMPRNDGWGKTPTIDEIENWPGKIERW